MSEKEMNANGLHVYLRLAKNGDETLLEMPIKFNLSPERLNCHLYFFVRNNEKV